MQRTDAPDRWDRFAARHQLLLILVDIVFIAAAATLALLSFADGGPGVGWAMILVALAAITWLVGTRLQVRRVRRYDESRSTGG